MLINKTNIFNFSSRHRTMTFVKKCLITFLVLTISTKVDCKNLLEQPSNLLSQRYSTSNAGDSSNNATNVHDNQTAIQQIRNLIETDTNKKTGMYARIHRILFISNQIHILFLTCSTSTTRGRKHIKIICFIFQIIMQILLLYVSINLLILELLNFPFSYLHSHNIKEDRCYLFILTFFNNSYNSCLLK